MRPVAIVGCALALLLLAAARAGAQDPPSRIGPFVADVRGTIPRFPNEPQLAQSRGLDVDELPGAGLGLAAGAHLYFLKWKAITFGIGGHVSLARARKTPAAPAGQPTGRSVTERLTSISPQLSFNFGTGEGWSYISGGIGRSTWSVVPDAADPTPADDERLMTIDYGGGARWFAKRHLAFNVDVRFYAINPGTGYLGFPGGPRKTLLIMGAGISVK